MPAQASFWVGNKTEYGFVEFPIVCILTNSLVVDLRWHDYQHSKNQGNKQSFKSLRAKLT